MMSHGFQQAFVTDLSFVDKSPVPYTGGARDRSATKKLDHYDTNASMQAGGPASSAANLQRVES